MLRKIMASFLLVIPTYSFGFGLTNWNNWWGSWSSGHWGSGFYLGAGLGVDTTDFKEKAHVNLIKSFSVLNRTQLAAQGPFATIFGGYSWNCNMFYLAGELNANWSSADFYGSNRELVHGTFSKTSYDIYHSWGLSLLPGLMLPETTLLYGRLGYARGSFDINTTDTSLRDADSSLRGLRLGIGMEKRIFQDFGIRFEYSHINYRSHNEFTVDPLSKVTKKTTVSPRSNLFEVDLNYRFC